MKIGGDYGSILRGRKMTESFKGQDEKGVMRDDEFCS
jgi:hypothetical protein